MEPSCMVYTRGTREHLRDRNDAHKHQQRLLSRSKQRRAICSAATRDVEHILSMDGSELSLYGTRDAAAIWEDACARVLQEHQFERGFVCPCSFYF